MSLFDCYAPFEMRKLVEVLGARVLFPVVTTILKLINRLGYGPWLMRLAAQHMSSPKRKRKVFRDYVPTKHDVLVCTAAKSGTNWALQIVTEIAHRGRAEFEHIHDVAPWPDAPMPGIAELSDPTHQGAPTLLRAVKTHLEADFVPYNPNARYVVVIRDPKDALVSAYFFAHSLIPGVLRIDLEDWVTLFPQAHTIFGSWSAHTASYWPWRNRDNVLVLFFSDMKDDLKHAVGQVADLMQVGLSDDELELVVEKSSFEYMKQLNDRFAPKVPDFVRPKTRPVMMRSGKKNSSREYLNLEQQAYVDRRVKAQLQDAGSDFPYDELFSPDLRN